MLERGLKYPSFPTSSRSSRGAESARASDPCVCNDGTGRCRCLSSKPWAPHRILNHDPTKPFSQKKIRMLGSYPYKTETPSKILVATLAKPGKILTYKSLHELLHKSARTLRHHFATQKGASESPCMSRTPIKDPLRTPKPCKALNPKL